MIGFDAEFSIGQIVKFKLNGVRACILGIDYSETMQDRNDHEKQFDENFIKYCVRYCANEKFRKIVVYQYELQL